MDSPKREKVKVMQLHHYQQTLNIRNTINNANSTTNLNENEHKKENTSQSSDTSEICWDEETKFAPVKTITPPISKLAGGKLTEAAPKANVAVVNSNEETENAAMVFADASKMSTATPTDTNPISIPKTLVKTLAITTIEDPENTRPNSKVDEFVVPVIPDAKAINRNGGVGETGPSAKRKRNKSSKKREDNKTRTKANSNIISRGSTDGNRYQPNIAGHPINAISGTANMKTSVSMTSLPPDDEKTESRDVIKAKLNVERPYNSLKKSIERNAVRASSGVTAHCFNQSQSSTSSFANHRYSWGSGYSYSSSSLQSCTMLGLGSAKDDLWAAIQANYNYIMDTNLLDSCKEAERHLADQNEANVVGCEQSQCGELLGVTQRREISWHDPKELRKWLCEMEKRLESAPTLSAVTTLTTAELQQCLAEHSVLYHEIVSHARVVSACIRSATAENQGRVLLQQQQEEQQLQSITTIAEQTNSSLTSNGVTTLTIATGNEPNNHELSSVNSSSVIETAEKSSFSPGPSLGRSNTASSQKAAETKITEDSLERLQNRYHLLYLKAFEVQLWLDGLLRKKSSTASIVDAAGYIDDNDDVNCQSSECEEDEASATEDALNILGSGIESDITHNSSSVEELHDCIDLVEEGNCDAAKGDCEDGDDEGEEEDEDEVNFGRSRFSKPPRGYSKVLVTFEKRGNLGGPSRSTTLTDFEADSESSDWETTAQQVLIQKSDDAVIGARLQLFNRKIPTNSIQIVTPTIGEESSEIAQLPFAIHTSSSARFESYLQQDDIDGLIANKKHENVLVSASSTSMKTNMNMLNADVEQRKLVSMSASTVAATITTTTANETNATFTDTQSPQKLQTLHNNKPIGLPIKQKSIAIISPNSHNNKSPTVFRKRQTQQHTDISKFNRSNRKSKNCAVFYFKHLDTDIETNCSSVGDAADYNTTDPADGLSSSNSQTCEHHLLKSADASSDDDGGWLYSAVLPPQREKSTGAGDGVGIDEKGNICITTIVIDGMHSSAVTSSSALTTTPIASSVINDDSDKENEEAPATTLATALTTLPTSKACAQSSDISSAPSSQNRTQIAHAEIQLTTVSTISAATAAKAPPAGRFKTKNFGTSSGSGKSSSYSTRSSSCSSNDPLTETTSATNTTQITQMHFQRVHRTEMELQIDNGNKSKQMMDNGASSSVTTHNSHNNNNNGDTENNNSATNRDENANYNANNNPTQLLQQALISSGNNQKNEMSYSVRWHPKTVIDSTNKTSMQYQQIQKMESKKVILPPRSPLKSEKPLQSTARGDNFSPNNATKGKLSHESIKQLVLEAEHLVRDVDQLKTPNKQKQKHSVIKLSSTVKKREIAMPGPIKQRVQEWLEHQPASSTSVQGHRNPIDELQGGTKSKAGDDCEASGEASETDSVPQLDSDTSEELTESIATCMQTSTNSFGGNSTECFGSSVEPIVSSATILGFDSSNQSLNVKIVKRSQSRRKSERPWSVSCLSQLTTETVPTETITPVVGSPQTGLANHSISESALDSLSPGRQRVSSSSTINVTQGKASNSKGSLKRRKTRKKKISTFGNLGVVVSNTHSVLKKNPDSGSEDISEMPRLTQTLLMKLCESMSTQQIREITSALFCLEHGSGTNLNEGATGSCKNPAQYTTEESQQHPMQQQQQKDMSEGVPLMKPNFRVGSYTTAHMRNEKRLGSLAALATYMNDEEEEQQGAATPVPQKQREYTTGTEDHHSSFSETAWDNYQEKYNSENYSEGFDSDAARKLMEFGDDYRNFIDSQSDCCSSLSAANNLDSLSPPRMDSLPQADTKTIMQDTIANSVDHARRRRALDLEYERRRKTLEVRRKSCQDSTDTQNTRSAVISASSSVNAIIPRIGFEKVNHQKKSDSTGRKLEFGMSQSTQSLRRTSESDTSTRRRKIDDRRRSSRNLDKSIKVIPATSSSCDDSDDEKEMRNLLQQSRNRLEDTEALKIRCHLLRPEDYTEIICTCRDNIRCLEAVLRGPPGTVLSAQCTGQTKDLLAAWEDLLSWSENAASARKMQEEMIVLKHSLSKLGNNGTFELLDTEPQIQVAIEALKNEKKELQNYRTNMLRLNASVHSWLTRQERRLQKAIAEGQLKDTGKVDVESLNKQNIPSVDERDVAKCSSLGILQGETDTVTTNIIDATKNMSSSIGTSTVGSGTKVLNIQILINSENEFHKHLKNEVSGMYSAWDDADARINTQLERLTNSLVAWRQLESGLYEFQQALGHDRGTLKGLEGALDKGQTTPVELAQNVKVVAKLLSERVNVSEEQLTAVREHLDPNHILHITKFTASNGSLSDSGISDGGATSDGGLSERERRLGVLRRLVKQLELALAPGSEAMKSIAVRMESAEAELKNLQNTCRDLIVRTAASHQNKKMQQKLQKTEAQQLLVPVTEIVDKSTETSKSNSHVGGKEGSLAHDQNNVLVCEAASKRNCRRKQSKRPSGSDINVNNNNARISNNTSNATEMCSYLSAAAPDSGEPADDPDLEFDLDIADNKNDKAPYNNWAWRIAKAAVPMQLALITFLCAACLMQPNCCDNLNNLSMSFTPQLRYIRGPPPI